VTFCAETISIGCRYIVETPRQSASDGPVSSFVPVTPVRMVDTRDGLGLSAPLAATQPVLVQITGTTYTVVGRATGTSQISTAVLVQTTSINSILTVRNPAGSSTALTITPLAGGTRPVSATLLIELVE